MSRVILVVDTNYLCHRAKHSTGHLTFQASPTGVIFGLLHEIMRLRKEFKPQIMAFCFDSRYSKRKDLYPQYKQAREDRHAEDDEQQQQFEIGFRRQVVMLRKEYLPAMGFNNVFVQRGYEADDIMAAICMPLQMRSGQTSTGIIISGDHDMYQCLRHNIMMYDPMHNIRMTLSSFQEKYGINPGLWWKVKALAGCTSDGISGISGVGEKTAIKFIRDELSKTTKAYQSIRQDKLHYLRTNSPLVLLPMEGTRVPRLRPDRISKRGWKEVCTRLGFKSMIGKSPWKRDQTKGQKNGG